MINIGGGYFFKRHWKVLDRPSQWYSFVDGSIDYVFDLTSNEPFPLATASVSFFYSSHTLEHIPQGCCQHVLDEIYRCLKPDGAVRLVMPDFDRAYEAFAQTDLDFFNGYPGTCLEEKFLDCFATYLKDKVSPEELGRNFESMPQDEFADYYTGKIPQDSQKIYTGNHINWWNYEKLDKMLKQAGFRAVHRSTKQDSRFTEMRGRDFDTHPEVSLYVEAVK